MTDIPKKLTSDDPEAQFHTEWNKIVDALQCFRNGVCEDVTGADVEVSCTGATYQVKSGGGSPAKLMILTPLTLTGSTIVDNFYRSNGFGFGIQAAYKDTTDEELAEIEDGTRNIFDTTINYLGKTLKVKGTRIEPVYFDLGVGCYYTGDVVTCMKVGGRLMAISSGRHFEIGDNQSSLSQDSTIEIQTIGDTDSHEELDELRNVVSLNDDNVSQVTSEENNTGAGSALGYMGQMFSLSAGGRTSITWDEGLDSAGANERWVVYGADCPDDLQSKLEQRLGGQA